MQHFYSFVSQVISLLPQTGNSMLSKGLRLWDSVSAFHPAYHPLSPFLLVIVSASSPFVSGLVSLLVGHCVHLVSLPSPFVSLLVSLLVGHSVRLSVCVRLVSLPFSLLVGPCVLVLLFPFVCHCVRPVSLLSPFVSGLDSLLVSQL